MLGTYREASVFPRTTRFPTRYRASPFVNNPRGGRLGGVNSPMEYKIQSGSRSSNFNSLSRAQRLLDSLNSDSSCEAERKVARNGHVLSILLVAGQREFAIYPYRKRKLPFARNPNRSSDSCEQRNNAARVVSHPYSHKGILRYNKRYLTDRNSGKTEVRLLLRFSALNVESKSREEEDRSDRTAFGAFRSYN